MNVPPGTKTTKQPDALDSPVANPSPTTPPTASSAPSTSGSSGIAGVSCCPPYSPYSVPYPQTYRPASSEGASYSARSGLLPPTAPAISYWHQSGNLWSVLPRGITLPMLWPHCPPAWPDSQRGTHSGDYPGWPLYPL